MSSIRSFEYYIGRLYLYCIETRIKKQTQRQRQKNLLTMTSGGFVIVVRKNSFIEDK